MSVLAVGESTAAEAIAAVRSSPTGANGVLASRSKNGFAGHDVEHGRRNYEVAGWFARRSIEMVSR